MGTKILIADDDPDIREILKITLSEGEYEIIEASNGQEALEIIRSRPLDLALLDYKMPLMDGRQVCNLVKKDLLLQYLPVIMVTGKGEVSDKISGIDAGADDYVVKPFEPKELMARIRMVLRRTQRDLEANPLTRLPGNVSILNELSKCVETRKSYAVCYVDLDKFKAYNDKYGFECGDTVIRETARILLNAVKEFGSSDNFVGHIGGDDFVVVTTPDLADKICEKIIHDFDKISPTFYNQEDKENGFIIGYDRQSKIHKIPLLSISIGVVSNEMRSITHVAQIGEIGAELKKLAKSLERSNYVKDKRQEKP
ncbi:MAG: response regulator [Candidatus Omnitrophica bacterium]|nr:response regulator [Candidatus Omnitrophota bacterium]